MRWLVEPLLKIMRDAELRNIHFICAASQHNHLKLNGCAFRVWDHENTVRYTFFLSVKHPRKTTEQKQRDKNEASQSRSEIFHTMSLLCSSR
jgi:hypothetical protein